jgi:hypothetical protein
VKIELHLAERDRAPVPGWPYMAAGVVIVLAVLALLGLVLLAGIPIW